MDLAVIQNLALGTDRYLRRYQTLDSMQAGYAEAF